MQNGWDESRYLRQCLRDLIALSTLPAVWVGRERRYIAESLADVFLSTRRLDIIYICLKGSPDEAPIEVVHADRRPDVVDRAQEIGQRLAPWLKSDSSDPFLLIPHPLGDGMVRVAIIPIGHEKEYGVIAAGSQQSDFPGEIDRVLLHVGANQAATALQGIRLSAALHAADRLAEEKLYLEDEIRTEHNFEEIIGKSPALKRILKQVEKVAPTPSTVLILGESGTGKELIARAIHNLSPRRQRTFMKLNCAAIPTGLIESELFGHERGAFTGALAKRVGRFELADRGTLFLDEVGDISLELQPKLLRVLQEQEFERLGSTQTLHVDVRLVAATNRDLRQMVDRREFREDLYYRLSIFPLRLPPLRERPEDIPLLVRHFAAKYARRMNKSIETIPTEAMAVLAHYPWPGNVRELQNFIERATILSPGPVLQTPLAELKQVTDSAPARVHTLEEAARDQILQALEEAQWVVGGPRGAAQRLGLKRTTLLSKMRKLGITRSP